jgi:hypothetical protein
MVTLGVLSGWIMLAMLLLSIGFEPTEVVDTALLGSILICGSVTV